MSERQPDRVERRAALVAEDPACVWCGRILGDRLRATTDHVVPVVKGGPSWRENELPACRRCNGQRGHQTPVAWFEECLRRGWRPDRRRLESALTSLEAAIARRGGQRRARPYLAHELRRLRRVSCDSP